MKCVACEKCADPYRPLVKVFDGLSLCPACGAEHRKSRQRRSFLVMVVVLALILE